MVDAVADSLHHASHEFVVLAYNDSPFLPDCLKSLKNQGQDARIILTTSTPSEYISKTSKYFGITPIINPNRVSIASDWNFAIKQSNARYITLAHQDDIYEPSFLSRTIDIFSRYPRGSLCFTGYHEIGNDKAIRTSKISVVKHLIERAFIGNSEIVYGNRMRAFLSFGNPLPCSSVTFDRLKLKDFEFSERFASNLDWDAWVRLYRAGATFLHVSTRLVSRRHNELTETSRLISAGTRQQEDLEMFERLWPKPLAHAMAWAYRFGY